MKASPPDDMNDDDPSAKDTGGALGRGLRLLTALNDLETATVAGLVAETGLAKPTTIRLLKTLVTEGYAAQDPDTLTYAVTPRVSSLSRALVGRNQVDDAIQAVLDSLADSLKWPTEFLVPEGDSMVIRLNNRERAPIRLRLFERRRFPILESASGFAYLAELPGSERQARLDRLGLGAEAHREVVDKIALVTKDGYASRRFPALAANMRVVSVSIPGGFGALSLVHFDDVVTLAMMEEALVPALRDAAERIGEHMGL
ncbi:MAG: helix-turn-helix domain-containing protein [Pseudomonadota bacterium]